MPMWARSAIALPARRARYTAKAWRPRSGMIATGSSLTVYEQASLAALPEPWATSAPMINPGGGRRYLRYTAVDGRAIGARPGRRG